MCRTLLFGNSFNNPKLVGILSQTIVENTLLVELILANFAAGVDDATLSVEDTNVDDGTLIVVEEGQIASFSFGYKVDGFPFLYLLAGIAG